MGFDLPTVEHLLQGQNESNSFWDALPFMVFGFLALKK